MEALPSFVYRVPDYEVRDGHIYASHDDVVFIVMPLEIFRQANAKAQAAIAKWQARRFPRATEQPPLVH